MVYRFSTRLQEIENVEFTNDGALGISVYLGQQKGNASTSDLSEEAIKNTVEAALAIANILHQMIAQG